MDINNDVVNLYNQGKMSYAVLLALSLVPDKKFVSRLYFFRIIGKEYKNDHQLRSILTYCVNEKYILKKRLSNEVDNGFA